jgi:hypothetical protein
MTFSSLSILLVNLACPFYIAWMLGRGWSDARSAGGSRLTLYRLSATLAGLSFSSAYFLAGLWLVPLYRQPDPVTTVIGVAVASLVLGFGTAVLLIDVFARIHARRQDSKGG